MAIANYIKTCAKNVPGNKYQFFITEIANVTGITETSNEVSAVTMLGGTAKFKRVNAEIDSIQFTSDGTYGTAGGETQNLILKLGNRSTALEVFLASLKDAAACGMAVIWGDNNGKYWLMGANATVKDGTTRPITKLATAFDSGLLITDEGSSAYTVTLTKLGAYAPVTFDSTLTAKITTTMDAAFLDWT
jgi:hypothetical protein